MSELDTQSTRGVHTAVCSLEQKLTPLTRNNASYKQPPRGHVSQSSYLLAKCSLAASLKNSAQVFSAQGIPIRIGRGLDGCVSRERGFLGLEESQRRLPGKLGAWEQVHDRLPVLIRQGRARQTVDSMPQLGDEFEQLPEKYLARASIVLSALAHAYFFAPQTKEEFQLPLHIDSAWGTVCYRLGRPFTGRVVADDFLNNARIGRFPFELSSSWFGLPEERLTSGLQGRMEYEFAPVLGYMAEAQNHVLAGNDQGMVSCLGKISAYIVKCANLLQEITPQAKDFDPIIWTKSYLAIGNAVRQGELGNSGADAPLFHALDAFLGRENNEGDLRGMQTDRRKTLPIIIQTFLQALEDPAVSVRDYAEKSHSASVESAFDGVLQLYNWFLEWHRVKAVGITGLSLASGRQKTSSGVKLAGQKDRNWPAMSPTEMLSRQMKASMASRLGSRKPWQTPTVSDIASGEHADHITLCFDAPLPLSPGDRVLIWPSNSLGEISAALAALRTRFGRAVDEQSSGLHEMLSKMNLRKLRPSMNCLDMSVGDVVASLPDLRPRFYSIGDAEPNEEGLSSMIRLTVGHGKGVCTSYLRGLERGDRMQVSLCPYPRFNLPADISVPLVLVGQGSGVGPLLGYIRTRARSLNQQPAMGKVLFFVGARQKGDVDCLDNIVELTCCLPLTVCLALTGDDNATIERGRYTSYPGVSSRVPEVLQQQIASITSILDAGGHVFVCGSTEFGNAVRKGLGKAPKGRADGLSRVFLPEAPTDWRRYHEDLFGNRRQVPPRNISTAELALHNSFGDCWTSLDGIVYDLTKYMVIHPGGSKVLIESAGTNCDRRFYQTHGGLQLQEVYGRLGPYAIGWLDTGSLSKPAQKALETTVRIQNTLTNNTAFSAHRQVPFFVYCDALIIFAKNGLDEWRDALPLEGHDALEVAQRRFRERFTELKKKCWERLSACSSAELDGLEREVRQAYVSEAEGLHAFLDRFKASLLRSDS